MQITQTIQLMISFVIRGGGILTNLGFAGYLFFAHEAVFDYFLHDRILESASSIIREDIPDPLLGIILLAAAAGEFAAFVLKSKHGGLANSNRALFWCWFFHPVVSIIFTVTALGAFGIGFSSNEHEGILAAVLFGTVIKELVMIAMVVGASPSPNPSKVKNFLADLLFLIYYCLAYTVVISNILKPVTYDNYLLASHYAKPLLVMNAFVIILLFFIFYLPLRIPYFMFENKGGFLRRTVGYISMALVAAAAVMHYSEGESSLESALKNPEKVEILFLNSSNLNKVPDEVFQLKNLKALHLGYNSLAEIPERITELKRLEWIGLGGNRFRQFPVKLLEMPSLTDIDLHYNGIRHLPENITGFSKLRSLHLRLNPLSEAEKQRAREAYSGSTRSGRGLTL